MRRNIFGIALFFAIVITSVYVSNVLIEYQESVDFLQETEISPTEVPEPIGSFEIADVEIVQAVFEPSTGTFEIQLKSNNTTTIQGGSLIEIELRDDSEIDKTLLRQMLSINSTDTSFDGTSAILRFKWRERRQISATSNLFLKIRNQSTTGKSPVFGATAKLIPVLIRRGSD